MQRRFHEDFPITSLLLLLILGFYVLEVLAQRKLVDQPEALSIWGIHPRVFEPLGALYAGRVVEGREVWRLVSSTFLHGGAIHLLFNTIVLWDLGRACEPLLSSYKFFTAYVICGLGGSAARCLWVYTAAPGEIGIPSVGASGALLGLIGLLLVYSIRERHTEMKEFLVRWVIYIAIITFLVPFIDMPGHVGGFVTGCVLGLTVRDYMTSTAARRWRIPSWGAGLAVAASLATALWNYFSELWERS